MQMEDRLLPMATAVDHRAVPVVREAVRFGQLGCYILQPAQNINVLLRDRSQGGDVPTRNDEKMRRCLWIDVTERHNVIVFVNDLARHLLVDDSAKETFFSRQQAIPPGSILACDIIIRRNAQGSFYFRNEK